MNGTGNEREANRRVALQFCTLYSAGDWESLGRLLADDFRWRQLSSQHRQSPGLVDAPRLNEDPGYTKAQTIQIFSTTKDRCLGKAFSLTAVETTCEGDRVALEAVGHAVNEANGRVYDNRYHHLFTIRRGQIHELREYQDTLLLYDVWLAP